MHRLDLIAILWFPAVACAAGYGGATGKNALGEIIHITGDVGETMSVQKNAGDHEWAESYVLKDECPVFTDTRLACLPGRKSPLSGVTYKITTSKKWTPCNIAPYHDRKPGEVYICIAGCQNRRAPKIFHVDPWEC